VKGNAEPFIGSVGQVAFVGNGRLLVQDAMNAELMVFDADGQPLHRMGRQGEGPGEFQMITQLSVTSGDTVHAFDYPAFRITSFDPAGALVTTIAMPNAFAGPGTFPRYVWALGSDRFLLHGYRLERDFGEPPTGPARPAQGVIRDAMVGIVASDGTERAAPINFPGTLHIRGRGYVAPSPFSNRPFVTVNRGRILYGSGRTYELILRDLDLRVATVIRWSGWEHPLTEQVLEAYRGPLEASIAEYRNDSPQLTALHKRMVEDFFRPELRPDTLPALASVMLDENGRIWVARFRLEEDLRSAIGARAAADWDQEDVWHVLDPDGNPIARVRMPPETRLLAVRSDRVAVVTRNELDVQTVRVLPITEPSK
jgi:hypothetical protein